MDLGACYHRIPDTVGENKAQYGYAYEIACKVSIHSYLKYIGQA